MATGIKLVGLKRKGVDTKQITLKMDAELLKELEDLEQQAEASGHTIVRSEIIEDAFRSFIREAKSELAKVKAPRAAAVA